MKLKVFTTPSEWMHFRQKEISEQSLGFVPTMGALHRGHGALIARAQKENDKTLVSLFVNPTQFDRKEDFEKYPRPKERDLRFLEDLGVNYVFAPEPQHMYPSLDSQIRLTETPLSEGLCGAHRPGHFSGMLTVVLKLLQIAGAQKAYFGDKDFQQRILVEELCKQFFIKTLIVPCPIVRDDNGLALSSRNERLSHQGIARAQEFAAILKESIVGGSAQKCFQELKAKGFQVEYVEDFRGHRCAAVFIENVRLIDNRSLKEAS